MIIIGQSVDHRNGRHSGKFFNIRLRKSTDHNPGEITAQNVGCIADSFAAAELHLGTVQIERIAAEFMHTDFKRYPGAGGGFGKDQSDAFAFKNITLNFAAALLEITGQIKKLIKLALAYIPQCQ